MIVMSGSKKTRSGDSNQSRRKLSSSFSPNTAVGVKEPPTVTPEVDPEQVKQRRVAREQAALQATLHRLAEHLSAGHYRKPSVASSTNGLSSPGRPNLPNGESPKASTSSTLQNSGQLTACLTCKGQGHYLLVDEAHPLGTVKPCPHCANLLKHSRLNAREQQSQLCQISGDDSALVLRVAGQQILSDPFGWFTVWGGTGSAKTLFLQALVVAFCKQGIQASYYHAGDLQAGLMADIEQPDRANMELYRRLPVLAIDEIDKYHWKDWSRKQLQALLDWRYRNMDTQVTLFASNKDPLGIDRNGDYWLAEDIASRMQDGRFHRTWPDAVVPPEDIAGYVPGIYHVLATDMRPHLAR